MNTSTKRKISDAFTSLGQKIDTKSFKNIVTCATNRAIYLKRVEDLRDNYLEMIYIILSNLKEKQSKLESEKTLKCILYVNKIVRLF